MSGSKNKLGKIVNPEKQLRAEDYISTIIKKLNANKMVKAEAYDVLSNLNNSPFNEKKYSQKGVAGAVVYLAAFNCDSRYTQKKIAEVSNVTVASIGVYYRCIASYFHKKFEKKHPELVARKKKFEEKFNYSILNNQ